ncbi:TIP41-like protein [Ptychodera flava]|uniref:TIP41-like protein n=1 Tax=Ptychodera flava TaxID=63121 RepID=UPI00396A8ED8
MAGTERSGMKENFQFGPWSITVVKSHILKSNCVRPEKCKTGDDEESTENMCTVCRYQRELHLPQIPEMVFGENVFRIAHTDGFGIEFNALDALKLVDDKHDLMKVAVAEQWQQARQDNEFINEVVKPFDWTFTTDYKGTLLSKNSKEMKSTPTDLRIDMEKLKIREKIFFFEEVVLFEDELADNGTAFLSVKVRVMQTSFFILLRYFLRIDNVLIRINDTRIYHEAEWNYMLREFTSKEKKIADLLSGGVSSSKFTNPLEVADHLDVVTELYEKLEFPESADCEN